MVSVNATDTPGRTSERHRNNQNTDNNQKHRQSGKLWFREVLTQENAAWGRPDRRSGRPLTVSEGFLLQEVRDVQVILAAAGEIGLNNGRKVDVES